MIYCEWHFTIGKLDIRVRFKISVDCTQIRPANREVPISWNSSSVLRTKWNSILYVTKSCVEPFFLFEHGDLYCWIFINFKLFAQNKLFTEMSDLPAKLKLVSKQRRKLMSKYYNASFASRIMAFGNSYCRSHFTVFVDSLFLCPFYLIRIFQILTNRLIMIRLKLCH